MKLLVVGGGGREHAIIKKLKENPTVGTIYALPGNGGIAADAVCVPIRATDIDAICDFAAENGVDYAVVAPDDPLAAGCVDALTARGVPCFGPTKAAAEIESSKVFAKNLMRKYGIPTADYRVFTSATEAEAYLASVPLPTVIKADGLALGKGVVIAETREAAMDAVRGMMEDKKFGASGETIVVEEFLTGPEVSVLAFTDGETLCPMVSSMDHKRALDGDRGPNTGGMGAVAPNPYYTPAIAAECMEKIFLPTIRAMRAEGRPFRGCLYFGLMLTPRGPKVIEYNCRFGDPETQAVLPLLESDLLTVMRAVTDGTLDKTPVRWRAGCSCCVVLASEGYPQHYETGFPIAVPDDLPAEVFVAGAKERDGALYTAGGRVLGCTCVARSLREAVDGAYRAVARISFENVYYRHDIGAKALAAEG